MHAIADRTAWLFQKTGFCISNGRNFSFNGPAVVTDQGLVQGVRDATLADPVTCQVQTTNRLLVLPPHTKPTNYNLPDLRARGLEKVTIASAVGRESEDHRFIPWGSHYLLDVSTEFAGKRNGVPDGYDLDVKIGLRLIALKTLLSSQPEVTAVRLLLADQIVQFPDGSTRELDCKNAVVFREDPRDPHYSGEAMLIYRTMHQREVISWASHRGADPLSGYRPEAGSLPGFEEAFADSLRGRFPESTYGHLQKGPGANAIWIPQLQRYVSTFHWVWEGEDHHRAGRKAIYYVGGLFAFRSITDPKVDCVLPFGLSPLDVPLSCQGKPGLFSAAADRGLQKEKYIVFPLSLQVIQHNGAEWVLSSSGSGDTDTHHHWVLLSRIVQEFQVAYVRKHLLLAA